MPMFNRTGQYLNILPPTSSTNFADAFRIAAQTKIICGRELNGEEI
jgi:hypothetical protein